MFDMLWPIGLLVLSNVLYNICSKSMPADVHPLAVLPITYLISAVISTGLYLALERGGNLLQEYSRMNWSSFLLGVVLVGLECGSIYMYKAGWDLSTGQMIYSALIAICLIFIGWFFYHETITATKLLGVVICMVGLYFINK